MTTTAFSAPTGKPLISWTPKPGQPSIGTNLEEAILILRERGGLTSSLEWDSPMPGILRVAYVIKGWPDCPKFYAEVHVGTDSSFMKTIRIVEEAQTSLLAQVLDMLLNESAILAENAKRLYSHLKGREDISLFPLVQMPLAVDPSTHPSFSSKVLDERFEIQIETAKAAVQETETKESK